jgi:CheY-like chemotaxis protein
MTKIILVEDDLTMRSLLKMLLELEDYVVVECDKKNEVEIVATIVDEKPDVVLLDVHIHKINGIDVMKRIRSDPNAQDMKVLMSSGMAMEEQCLKAGANGFLLKPYMPDDLLNKVRSL